MKQVLFSMVTMMVLGSASSAFAGQFDPKSDPNANGQVAANQACPLAGISSHSPREGLIHTDDRIAQADTTSSTARSAH